MARWLVVICGALLLAGCKDTCVPTADNPCTSTSAVGGVAQFGALPSGSHFSLDCTPFNVPAFANSDCLYSHVEGVGANREPVTCTAKLADRVGLVIGTATQVSFMAEAGDISPAATSPAYDPAKPVTEQVGLGHATGWLEIFGAPLPADVPPMAGEPSLQHDFGCGVRTANPRDGFVTVIAWARGEEGFVDANRNGRYDHGEPFVDEGEPFVDADDNGQWDAGEWYLDVNGNGKYDGPNGTWDADAIIWTQTRVLYTGLPGFAIDGAGNRLLSRIYAAGRPPAATPPPASFSVAKDATVSYGVWFTDDRLNPLTTQSSIGVASVTSDVTPAVGTTLPLPNLVGDSFRLLYCPSQEPTAACLDGPVEHGCVTAPCYVVPDVGQCRSSGCAGLVTGQAVDLFITGSKPGSDVVTVSATVEVEANGRLNQITSGVSIAGVCTP